MFLKAADWDNCYFGFSIKFQVLTIIIFAAYINFYRIIKILNFAGFAGNYAVKMSQLVILNAQYVK